LRKKEKKNQQGSPNRVRGIFKTYVRTRSVQAASLERLIIFKLNPQYTLRKRWWKRQI